MPGFVDTRLLAEDRRLPIIAVAVSGGRPEGKLDLARLARQLAGFAHVVLVETAALPRLAERLEALSLDRASARVWWPGIGLDDEPLTHPTWKGPFPDPHAVAEVVRRAVLETSRDRWREPPRLVTFNRGLRQAQEEASHATADRLVQEIQRLRTAALDNAAPSPSVAGEPPAAAVEDDEHQLAAMAEDVTALREELDRQHIAVEDAEGHWAEAEERKESLERENRSLHGQLENLKFALNEQAAAQGAQPATDEEVFEDDVRKSWEDRLTPHDREAFPLGSFTVREDLLASITRSAADRGKVVDTVMEVACGRAPDIEGRRVHRLRRGSGGNAPFRTRERDGASAWRCNVQTDSPSARRLQYWICPGGKMEFVSVAVHDDFSMAE